MGRDLGGAGLMLRGGAGGGVFTYLARGHALRKILPSPAVGAEGPC